MFVFFSKSPHSNLLRFGEGIHDCDKVDDDSGGSHLSTTFVMVINPRTPSTIMSSQRAVQKDEQKSKKPSYWNLPNKGQLAIMCLVRMADPLMNTSIQVLSAHMLMHSRWT